MARKVDNDTTILTQEEAATATPDESLPPPGYERNEELSRRADALEAKLEALSNGNGDNPEQHKIDLDNFKPDNEILQHLKYGNYPVQNKDELYTYCWVNRDIHGKYGGVHVMRKRVQGWQLCRYGAPEIAGVKNVDGTCIVGDVVLMKIRRDLYFKIHRQSQQEVTRRREGVTTGLRELGEQHAKHGVIVHTPEDIDDATLARMDRQASAKRQAVNTADKWIRQGKMPGVPGPTK
jgi:hypothetical protein